MIPTNFTAMIHDSWFRFHPDTNHAATAPPSGKLFTQACKWIIGQVVKMETST